jgi:hypothetical protein
MNKILYDKLGALEKLICDFIEESFKKGEYEIELVDKIYDRSGYTTGYLIFGGFKFRCSFNNKNYICWHCDAQLSHILENIPRLEYTVCKKVAAIVKKAAIDVTKKRIEMLEAELKELKGK